MMDYELLPEFQTRGLLQLLSILKADPQTHHPRPQKRKKKKYKPSSEGEKKLGRGAPEKKKNLNKCLPSFCCQAVVQ